MQSFLQMPSADLQSITSTLTLRNSRVKYSKDCKRSTQAQGINIQSERGSMIQEVYQDHPWRMLVCCIMLNCTSRDQVDQVRFEFFSRYPEPEDASLADRSEMSEILSSLGFKNRRTDTIIKFSREWIEKEWKDPIELFGIGKYGQDSWEIFQRGNLEIHPTDGALIGYLKKQKSISILDQNQSIFER